MDSIADYLVRINNAVAVGHNAVVIPGSNMRLRLTELLKKEGYIGDFDVEPAPVGSSIKIALKYADGTPAISGMKRVSKPGRRVYSTGKEIPTVLGGMGTAIISTSKGVMSGHDARKNGIGGEVVAYIW